ncbi:hypothetical protein FEM48_Zijuj01G0232300 [Ziziphus jujuba var. spinosa]|uniref:Uncharacterized protein n=1 Tax=Ziziphus jujuba var. spinosa TaxID=714518 RepID=A0A978W444_ZIZJJ|nr:hypothetical protein FEM48_Zijuj01G0232300 [Ziziphus jujuba var. spinosa]
MPMVPLGESDMEHSYGFYRQSSGLWRSLRDGDFEEEDVWAVLKDRTDPSIKIGRSKESSVSVPTHVPTAERMIPRADKGSVGRTLKGRDLSKVRNAVLTKTGFLESL